MSLEAAVADTRDRVLAVQDALLALRVTAVEDGPTGQESVLVDTLGDAVDDALGLVREAFSAAAECLDAAGPPLDTERVRFQLAACHDATTRLLRRVLGDVYSPRRGDDLSRIARRGQQWRIWSEAVKDAAERCVEPLGDAVASLGVCWREVADRSALVSVHSTNVGQQISMPRRRGAPPQERWSTTAASTRS
jgi:hypothetical protein